ncbi:hypothetical protein GWL_21750 [Herbaspirillum sp. GW103]|nr:hypothetical protein GWL_21750 [Herbaspirillum sp. GW103]
MEIFTSYGINMKDVKPGAWFSVCNAIILPSQKFHRHHSFTEYP